MSENSEKPLETTSKFTEIVVLVTGGSSCIGRATAIEFAKLGHRIVITGRNQVKLDSALDELAANCPDPANVDKEQHYLTLQVDLALPEQVDSVVDRVIAKYNRLDVLINSAGFTGRQLEMYHPDFYDNFQRVLQVNLLAPVRLAQKAVLHLKRSPSSALINVSSVADRVPFNSTMPYCVSKAGLSMFTKTLANALLGFERVRVLAVAPGPVRAGLCADVRLLDSMGTHSSLMLRAARAQEVANLIVFLASPKASYMHGSVVHVDGGQQCRLAILASDGAATALANKRDD